MGQHQQKKSDWVERVDWTQNDSDIGRSINRSRERVRQVRKALKKPPSKFKGCNTKSRTNELKRIIINEFIDGNNKPKLKTISIRTLYSLLESKKIKLSAKYAKLTVSSFGIDVVGQPKYYPAKIHFMNFDLPNNVLAKIWEMNTSGGLVSISRHRTRPPKWSGRCFSANLNDPRYIIAIKNEHISYNKYKKDKQDHKRWHQ